jgi:nucleoside-diphosphate-sugar epimerase
MKTILDILREQASKVRIVYVSSIAVQGIPREVPATEDTPTIISLRDLHTQHKERCEQLLREYEARCGLAVTILRHPTVYGRKDLPVEGLLRLLRRPGRIAVPYIGPGNYLTPFIHSEDFVQALLRAAENEVTAGEIYNIVDDSRISFRQFLEEAARILGVRLMFITLPKMLLRPITSALDWGGALLKFPVGSRRFLEYLTVSLAYENQKMKKHLGFSLRFPTVKEGLAYTFKAQLDRNKAEADAH